MKYKYFLDLLRHLKSNLPLPYPIRVKRVYLHKGVDGDCQLKKGKFFIRINKNLNENQAIDAIIHEIAHCLVWNENEETAEELHGPNWGKSYSMVYREFLKWNPKSETL